MLSILSVLLLEQLRGYPWWTILVEEWITARLLETDRFSGWRSVLDDEQAFPPQVLHHRDTFSPSTIATSLASLGMDLLSFVIKQIFEFLLGQVLGFRVPRQLQAIEKLLIADHKSKMDEFDCAAYSLTITASKKRLLQLLLLLLSTLLAASKTPSVVNLRCMLINAI